MNHNPNRLLADYPWDRGAARPRVLARAPQHPTHQPIEAGMNHNPNRLLADYPWDRGAARPRVLARSVRHPTHRPIDPSRLA